MKKIITVFILITLLSCDKINQIKYVRFIDRDQDSILDAKNGKFINKLTEFNCTGKLYYLCKVWGHLKYYGNEDTDWNNILISKLNKVEKSKNKNEFISVINSMFSHIKTDYKKKSINIDESEFSLVNYNWVNDSLYFNKNITKRLKNISKNRNYVKNKFAKQSWMTGTIKLKKETKYDTNYYPNKNVRLLGLFEYWNFINYYYVYKNEITENWDSVLLESINSFVKAENAVDYHLSVQELTSKLYDCHSYTTSDVLERYFGRNVPNFRMKKINDTFIVCKIRAHELDNKKIKVGDIITKINNIDVEKIYIKLNRYIKCANPQSEQRMINPYILASSKDTNKITFLRNNKKITSKILFKDYEIYKNAEISYAKSLKEKIVCNRYQDSIAYLNLKYLFKNNIRDNIKELKKAKKIIIDLRCYPNKGVSIILANFIISEKTDFFLSSYSDVHSPGLLRYKTGHKLGRDGYANKSKIVVLVNEYTQSQAEFLTMALQTSENVTVIGSQTAGSNGNITQFEFPGKIKTVFSGIGIYYPDLTPTQRVGIKIDYEITPTIRGIQEGKDEILERAIKYISTEKVNL
ncbi:MAG: hypothetical protein K8R54_12690 [Bacteroidales bacterium]|nr:hypothetical protein [Bacteroidales bacterium]